MASEAVELENEGMLRTDWLTDEVVDLPMNFLDNLRKAFHFVNDLEPEWRRGVLVEPEGITGLNSVMLCHFPFEAKKENMPRQMVIVNRLPPRIEKNTKACLRIGKDGAWWLYYKIFSCHGMLRKYGFHPWRQVVPRRFSDKIELWDNDRATVVKWLLKTAKTSSVRFTANGGTLRLEAFNEANQPDGDPLEGIHLKSCTKDEEMRVTFNAGRVLVFLRSLCHTVMELDDFCTPVRFSGGGGWGLLMPMRDWN
ncbi:MAG: hypothetical protein II894_09165 [Bacteroidales bacterium]|nr:hypothetical protein [Bacteroidales bacterium]